MSDNRNDFAKGRDKPERRDPEIPLLEASRASPAGQLSFPKHKVPNNLRHNEGKDLDTEERRKFIKQRLETHGADNHSRATQ